MFVFRILGSWCVIAAIMALIYDLTLIAQSTLTVTSVGQHWQALAPDSYRATQSALLQSLAPFLWNPVLTTILAVPAWALLGALGAIFYAVARRRSAVSVFAN